MGDYLNLYISFAKWISLYNMNSSSYIAILDFLCKTFQNIYFENNELPLLQVTRDKNPSVWKLRQSQTILLTPNHPIRVQYCNFRHGDTDTLYTVWARQVPGLWRD